MTQLTLSDKEFGQFQKMIYDIAGISMSPVKKPLVSGRLAKRVKHYALNSYGEYFKLLMSNSGEGELQVAIDLLTTNETYFFREEYQFQCLVNSILPEITAKKTDRSPIRIWIIPSSSGEEPYSVAISLLENWAGLNDWDIEIISSDIDTKILAAARKGFYSARSVAQLPPRHLQKYFTRTNDGFQICDDLRQAVEFTRVNLNDRVDTRAYRNFDVIFCRNLLIYFDDVSRKAAAETFYDALKPGGFILLGHSESMSRISSLYKVRKFPEAIVYQKSLESR